MKEFIKKVFKDAFTEPDNNTICPVRILGIAGFAWALCMSGWSVLALKVPFLMVDFGTSYGLMLAALGVAMGLKTDSKGTKNAIVAN